MMNNQHLNNQQQRLIDRMVDGELDDEQQRGLLRSCEQQQSWRDLALAYVESQTWRSELSQLRQEATTVGSEASVSQHRFAESRSNWRSLSLAASILFALVVGYGLGWVVQDVPRDAIVAENDHSPAAGDEARLSSMPFMVRDPVTRGLRQVDLPIVRASELGPNWLQRLEQGPPEEYVQELRGQGLDIRRTRTFTPIDLGDGRRVVVPIDYFIEHRYQ